MTNHVPFSAVEITDKVYWVGAVDWTIRDFHGYATNRGTTYNAFLILGEKTTLIDTVKGPFREEMLARIASVVPPERIDYIVSNHAEMDHSGALPDVVRIVKPERVFASRRGVDALRRHFGPDFAVSAVKEGERLDLGGLHLSFLDTPMLHWPESMFTLLEEQGLLFSQDAFGMHLASSVIFADELELSVLEYEAAKYFANILLPYAPRVRALMEKTGRLFETISMIAPDHGPVWRGRATTIIDRYHAWCLQPPANRAVVAYDTMWQSTASMATAVGEGLARAGVAVKLMPLKCSHRSDVAMEVFLAGALAVGSPTLNNNLFPTVADLMFYLKGLRPLNKVAAAFGSYGWAGEAVRQLNDFLDEMKLDRLDDGVRVKYVPRDEDLERCKDLGRRMAERLHERIREETR